MTVDTPLTTLSKPGIKTQSGGMSALFHDYAGPALPDHMLQLDLLPPDGSTNQMMYEQDPTDPQTTVLSPCASTTESTGSHFDGLDALKGLGEAADLLDLDVLDLPAFDHTGLKMEDVFQLGKRALEGPTLAALNADQSPLDEAEAVLGAGMDCYNAAGQQGWGNSSNAVASGLCQPVMGGHTTVIGSVALIAPNNQNTVPHTASSTRVQAPLQMSLCTTTPNTVAPATTTALPACSVTTVSDTISFMAPNKATPCTLPVVSPSKCEDRITSSSVAEKGTGWSCPLMDKQSATSGNPVAAATGVPAGTTTAPKSVTESKWEEIKQFIHDDMELNFVTPQQQQQQQAQQQTGPTAASVKGEVAYTPAEEDCSDDEDMDSDADSEFNCSFSDTGPSGDSATFLEEFILTGRKEKRYFWQYNTQSKGPKGKRLCKTFRNKDPHVLEKFEDPVFDPELNQNQYKHNGKARRGDGNDVNANPWKLYQIGRELAHLNRQMSGMVPVSEMPSPARSKTRKEKNKYASRACRLKKKAQHEAHKLKLHGLHQEHAQLLKVLKSIRGESVQRVISPETNDGEKLTAKLDRLIKDNLTVMIAGHTSEYVNSVLERIARTGDRTGGLRPLQPFCVQE